MQKRFSIFQYSQCIETSSIHCKSKGCSFKRFPFYPQLRRRSPCGTLLLKTFELASKKTYLYPFLMYCFLSLDVSLQSMFDRPLFSVTEKWRCRSVTSGLLQYVYHGQMWQKFVLWRQAISLKTRKFRSNFELWFFSTLWASVILLELYICPF